MGASARAAMPRVCGLIGGRTDLDLRSAAGRHVAHGPAGLLKDVARGQLHQAPQLWHDAHVDERLREVVLRVLRAYDVADAAQCRLGHARGLVPQQPHDAACGGRQHNKAKTGAGGGARPGAWAGACGRWCGSGRPAM